MTTLTLDTAVAIGNNPPTTVRVTTTAEAVTPINVTVPADSTAFEISPVAIDVSQLKFLSISSDKDVVIETNSSSSPADTLTIAAGRPLLWFTDCGFANPLGTDVTKLYVAADDAAALAIVIAQDVTPGA